MGERRHLGLELSILLPQPSDFCVTGICHHIQFYFLFFKTFMDSCQTRNPSYIHSEPCVFCKISDTYFSIDLCVMRLFQEVVSLPSSIVVYYYHFSAFLIRDSMIS